MSHSYVDGVPVKISEKYKQPPEIHLTTKLTQQLLKTKVAFKDDYNFDLERTIIKKSSEWMNWRMKERTERQQRIQQRDISRQQKFEQEQKEKLNQVSYPSTDDLTSSCDEQDDEISEKGNSIEAIKTKSIPESSEKVFGPNFNTILMPTQVNQTVSDKKSHRRYASNSSNKIDFSFFESDASPFDNLEIKSMNEMEELAKVLQSTTTLENQDSDENNVLERNNSCESDPSDCQRNNNNNDISTNIPIMNTTISNNPYLPAHNYNTKQLCNNYFYGMPCATNQQSYYNTQYLRTATGTPNQFSNAPYNDAMNHQQLQSNCFYTQNYAVNHMSYGNVINSSNNNNMACENSVDATNKSRSVPDIVKELNDELNNSEKRRTRNISQCNEHINSNKEEDEDTKIQKCDDQLEKLPVKSQKLVMQICQMGFKKDMVIKALILFGDNEKRIVDHLISLNEILQMGFDEERISEALIKFDNNKDQALDYLIS